MSELDPKVKEDLVKQIENMASGKVGVGGNATVENVSQAPLQTVAPSPQTQATQPVKFDSFVFGVAAVIIILAVAFFTLSRRPSDMTQQSQVQPYNNFQHQNPHPIGPYRHRPEEFHSPHPNNPHTEDSDIKAYVDRKIDGLAQRMNKTDHRVWLLAVANNENAMVSKKIADMIGPSFSRVGDKYILFDKEWKMNKVPEFLDLSSNQLYSMLKDVDENFYRRR